MPASTEHDHSHVYKDHSHTFRENEQRRDPTNTLTLRKRYAEEIRGRWNTVYSKIRQAIVKNDVFGLRGTSRSNSEVKTNQTSVPGSGAYAFDRDQKKVDTFSQWIQTLVNEEVVEPVDPTYGQPQEHWQYSYVRQAVQKGNRQATQNLRDAGIQVDINEDDYQQLFNRPIHMSTLNDMWTRQFEYMQSRVPEIDQALREELTAGFAQGHNPNKIGQNINQRIESIGRTRGTTFARTEVIKTHAETTLDTYERVGIKETQAQAEFITAADNFVCPICESIDRVQFKIDQARGMIPQHPRCFSDDTEVKTDEGWKYFYDLNGDEKIESLNPISKDGGYLPYNKVVQYERNDEMIRLESEKMDLLVTPDHNHPYLTETGIELKEVQELVKDEFITPTPYGNEEHYDIDVDRVNYNGMVYDVELPKWHILKVRRNGIEAWSGNCRCTWTLTQRESAIEPTGVQRGTTGRNI